MPWYEVSTVSLRSEFVRLAQNDDANISQLCERFRISRKTGYKWLARFRAHGDAGSERAESPTELLTLSHPQRHGVFSATTPR